MPPKLKIHLVARRGWRDTTQIRATQGYVEAVRMLAC